MKRIQGIVMVLGLMGALSVIVGCSQSKEEVIVLGKGLKLEMVLISSGKFKMGSPPELGEEGRMADETQHEVTLTKPFYMGKYEITQEQWEWVMEDNPSSSKGAKLPVTNVSFDDCQEFIKRLNEITKSKYRLPTEAEWEYACRAGTTTAYSYGNEIPPKDANYDGSNIGKPMPVGSYKANAFGLYDMHGNVSEYCKDWYGDYFEGSVTDPKGPATGEGRIVRGGSFNSNESLARSSARVISLPTMRHLDYGFRLVRTADIKAGVPSIATKPAPIEINLGPENTLVAPFTEAKILEVKIEVARKLQKELEETVDVGNGINLEIVLLPPGKFKMGSPRTEKDHKEGETLHEVTLTKPFYMGKYEVTQEQWEAVMGNNPSEIIGAKFSVTNVSWNDCQDFIEKLNAKTNGGYRLPTEAEWEYACRAGTMTAYSFGDSLTKNNVNYGDYEKGSVKPVGSYKANAFGLYDMHGNVSEYCKDWYGDYFEGSVTDPKGPATGEGRIVRGGSFNSVPWAVRSSFRFIGISPTIRNHSGIGFRLVKTI